MVNGNVYVADSGDLLSKCCQFFYVPHHQKKYDPLFASHYHTFRLIEIRLNL